MTKRNGMQDLLRDVLDGQDEDGRGVDLTEERVRHVLLERDTFSLAEQHILATSPLARQTYAEVVEELEIQRQVSEIIWDTAGVRPVTRNLVAAAGGQYPIVIPSDDFSVTVHSNPFSEGWIVTLTLHDRFRRIVRTGDVLALVDDQMVTWARGEVNELGEINSFCWPYDEAPAERIHKPGFSLRVSKPKMGHDHGDGA